MARGKLQFTPGPIDGSPKYLAISRVAEQETPSIVFKSKAGSTISFLPIQPFPAGNSSLFIALKIDIP
jgi:hypothetical protein